MNWCESIHFDQPVRDVRRLEEALPRNWETLVVERERAAYLRGQRDGEREVSERLLSQRTEMAGFQRGILESLERAVPQVIQEAEGALLHLALEVAQKVVGGMPVSPEIVEAVVREALAQIEETAEVTVQLHPEDLAALRQNDSALLGGDPETARLRFVARADLDRGDCLAQTRFGVVDARRETKLNLLKKTLSC